MPLLWLHISHIGISASVGSPVVLGILFWRVITVETAHLRCTKRERRFDNFNPSHYYWNWGHPKQVVQVMLRFCIKTQHHVQLQRESASLIARRSLVSVTAVKGNDFRDVGKWPFNRLFSVTWLAAIQISWNKRKFLHNKTQKSSAPPGFHWFIHQYGHHDVMWKQSLVGDY